MLDRLETTYRTAADPAKVPAMRAYMRDQFSFPGIREPEQKALCRDVLAGLGKPNEDDLRTVALGCWAPPEREFQRFGCGLLRRRAKICSAALLDVARHLIATLPWWDTVDALAAHLVGLVVLRHPQLVSTIDARTPGRLDVWIGAEDRWLVRTAILHQLGYKEDTDSARLFRFCTIQSEHTDVFIRKAIGWALREYAKTQPAAVAAYVREHQSRLAALSVREALKNL